MLDSLARNQILYPIELKLRCPVLTVNQECGYGNVFLLGLFLKKFYFLIWL